MRRKDREITDRADLTDIINKSDVCRIAFADGGTPYIVTLNFGYAWGERLTFFFHCAREGRKLDLLRKNSEVCFSMDTDHELWERGSACAWSMGYRSIVGYGTLTIVEDPVERKRALDAIMDHYGYPGDKVYEEKNWRLTELLKLEVREMTGKQKK
jgi:uncharacterized protein